MTAKASAMAGARATTPPAMRSSLHLRAELRMSCTTAHCRRCRACSHSSVPNRRVSLAAGGVVARLAV